MTDVGNHGNKGYILHVCASFDEINISLLFICAFTIVLSHILTDYLFQNKHSKRDSSHRRGRK